MSFLELIQDGQRRVISVGDRALTVGRGADNDIVVTVRKASRRHCEIELQSDALVVRDLDSYNGTWVGEERIIEVTLRPGAQFRIGTTQFFIDRGESLPLCLEVAPDGVRCASPASAPSVPEELSTGPLTQILLPLLDALHGRTDPGRPGTPRELRLLSFRGQSMEHSYQPATTPEGIAALQQLFFLCVRVGATDIHVEPKGATFGLRVRIDGYLHPMGDVPRGLGIPMLNIIKVLINADIAKRNVVQEGGFMAELGGRRVDFRASFTPIQSGQKLALRILDRASSPRRIEDLGMEAPVVEEFRRVLARDSGMVVASGPTGSGKTTTLATALQSIDTRGRNVVTIEDPVEYHIPGATQIPIDPVHNVTFASVLSSVLRQDPDVILVGEIRDRETAELALQAASSGHLVLTTVHARDAAGTIFRLMELGGDAVQIANAMSLLLSQRQVRVLCPYCKQPWKPDVRRLRELRIDEHQVTGGRLFCPTGCKKCLRTGYLGRMVVYEAIRFTPALRDVVMSRPTVGEIHKAAGDWLFRSLTDSAWRRVLQGLTSVDEVERISGDV